MEARVSRFRENEGEHDAGKALVVVLRDSRVLESPSGCSYELARQMDARVRGHDA